MPDKECHFGKMTYFRESFKPARDLIFFFFLVQGGQYFTVLIIWKKTQKRAGYSWTGKSSLFLRTLMSSNRKAAMLVNVLTDNIKHHVV